MRARYLPRTRSHDEGSSSPSVGTVKARIARQGAAAAANRGVKSRSPSISPVRAGTCQDKAGDVKQNCKEREGRLNPSDSEAGT